MEHFIIDTFYTWIVPFVLMPAGVLLALYGLTMYIISSIKSRRAV